MEGAPRSRTDREERPIQVPESHRLPLGKMTDSFRDPRRQYSDGAKRASPRLTMSKPTKRNGLMFLPVNGSWASGAVTEVVTGAVTGTAGVGGWVPVPEIGGGTGRVVVGAGGGVVVVVG